MLRVGLRISSFTIKRRYAKQGNFIPLNNEIECKTNDDKVFTVKDFFELINKFVDYYATYDDNEKQMRMFTISQESRDYKKSKGFRTLSFIIRSGTYGIESDIINRRNGKLQYKRDEEDADIKQFSCLFFVPTDVDDRQVKKGIVIFQEIGPYGIKTCTIDKISQYFADEFDITFDTRSISPSEYVKEVLKNGKVQRITYVKNCVSKDDSDNLLINAGKEEVSYVFPILNQDAIRNLFRPVQRDSDNAILEIPDEVVDEQIFEQYQDVRFSVKYAKRQKTISLLDVNQFCIVENVPEDYLFPNGQPRRDLLKRFMIDIARKYRDKMIFTR